MTCCLLRGRKGSKVESVFPKIVGHPVQVIEPDVHSILLAGNGGDEGNSVQPG